MRLSPINGQKHKIPFEGDYRMAHYINIDHANNKIYDRDEVVFSKKDLLQKFEEFVGVCGYQVTWINNKRAPYELQISNGIKEYTLILYLKNITGAGWFDKPHIKRVQVTNVRNDDMSKYIDTTNNQTLLILGYYNFDNNPIMVAWNAYHYVYHATNRSCYVTIDNLLDGYRNGSIVSECSEQQIWVFNSEHFIGFLDSYIETNKI